MTVKEFLKNRSSYINCKIKLAGTITDIKRVDSKTIFFLKEGKSSLKIIYNKNLPSNAKEGNEALITGKYNGTVFIAEEVIPRCPSKYKVKLKEK